MKQKLLNAKAQTPQCGLCEHGRLLDGDTEVLCPRNGVMAPDDVCRKFKYDPIKRKPNKVTLQTDFDPEEFTL